MIHRKREHAVAVNRPRGDNPQSLADKIEAARRRAANLPPDPPPDGPPPTPPVGGHNDRNSNVRMRRDIRRARIAYLYLRGVTNREELRRIVGCGKDTMDKDIAFLKAQWARESREIISEHVYLELVKLQRLEDEAHQAWERSRLDAVEVTESERETPDGVERNTTVKRRGQVGDAAFLRVVMEISRERSRLMGLVRESEEARKTQAGTRTGALGLRLPGIDRPYHLYDDVELAAYAAGAETTEEVEAYLERATGAGVDMSAVTDAPVLNLRASAGGADGGEDV